MSGSVVRGTPPHPAPGHSSCVLVPAGICSPDRGSEGQSARVSGMLGARGMLVFVLAIGPFRISGFFGLRFRIT